MAIRRSFVFPGLLSCQLPREGRFWHSFTKGMDKSDLPMKYWSFMLNQVTNSMLNKLYMKK